MQAGCKRGIRIIYYSSYIVDMTIGKPINKVNERVGRVELGPTAFPTRLREPHAGRGVLVVVVASGGAVLSISWPHLQ